MAKYSQYRQTSCDTRGQNDCKQPQKGETMISHFDDLLLAARAQPLPQRLLLIFAGAELPADADAEQRARFDAGEGGALVPLMCVDKRPDDVTSFAQLCTEADGMHSGWRVVLAGALSGTVSEPPSDKTVDQAFERLLGLIQAGQMDQVLAQTLAFTRDGAAVSLQA